MTSGPHGGASRLRPGHSTALVFAWIAAAVVAACLAFAAFAAIPPSLSNLASDGSDGETPYLLETDGVRAEVIVPSGWTVVRESADAVTVRTPDGVLSTRIDLSDDAPDAVVAGEPDVSTAPRAEVLSSGRDVLHADLGSRGVVAAVGVLGRDVSPSIRIVATVDDAHTMTDYRRALGMLLDGVGR